MTPRVFECEREGAQLRTGGDAIELMSLAAAHEVELIAIPVERLHADFFRLRTGVAGEFLQKFVTYRRRVAIVGDISQHVSESTALRDFVYECNRGDQIWFVADKDELGKRLED